MRAALVAVMLLVAACAGEAADETTTTTVQVAAPTTTSTVVAERVDICSRGRAIVWEPGQTYAAGCFLVPVSFAPVDSGWRTSRVEGDRFVVTLVEEGRSVAEVALLGYQPSSGLNVVADSILDIEGLTVVSDRSDVTVGGWPAAEFEVESGLDPGQGAQLWGDCHSRTLGTGIAVNGPGFRLLYGGLGETDEFGFSPCRTFRVWVVDAAGVVITMIATADEEPTLREAMPTIERLLASMSFEAP